MKKIYLMLAFMLVSVAMSAKTYKATVYQGEGAHWSYLEGLTYGEDGTIAFNVKVSDDKSTVTLLGWTGNAGDDVTFGSISDGVASSVNGVTLPDDDGYYSTWVSASGYKNGGYYGGYVYGGTTTTGYVNNQVVINEDGSGEGFFRIYDYDVNASRCVYYKWTTEEVAEITETEYPLLVSKDASYGYPHLPYNENGQYLTKISVASDLSYIIIKNWTGESDGTGENLKIYLNSEDGSIVSVNGSNDGYWPDLGSQTDGTYDYSYIVTGSGYSEIDFTKDDGSEGEGWFELYDYCASAYTYFEFSWPGELSPVTAIKSVDASKATNAPAYNAVGQRVNANTKGLVISNGKKYINK